MLDLYGVIACTPRVGQNAVLGSIRTVVPGANESIEWAQESDGALIFSTGFPIPPSVEAGRVRYARLSREDKVDQAISWAIAAATGKFHSHQKRRNPARPKFSRADVQTGLTAILDAERVWDDHLAGEDVLELIYEHDVVPNPIEAAERILRHFGIDREPGPTDIKRFDIGLKKEWRKEWDSQPEL